MKKSTCSDITIRKLTECSPVVKREPMTKEKFESNRYMKAHFGSYYNYINRIKPG